jgi:hypothetical protein
MKGMKADQDRKALHPCLSFSSVVNQLSAIKLIDPACPFLIIYGYGTQTQIGLIFRTGMDVYPGGELFGPHRLQVSILVLADV